MKGDDIANEYVEVAIEECDSLGREVFAKRYGFGPSTKFPLLYDGQEYDSKAIVGRAYALAHPDENVDAWTTGLQGGLRPGNAGYLLQEKGYEIDNRSNPGGPNAWMIRAGEHGEGESLALAESRTIVGWSELGPLTPEITREQLKAQIQDTYDETRSASLAQQAAVLYRFVHDVKVGDLVVIPLHTNPGHVAVGWITGDYEHVPDPRFVAADAINTRTVDWLSQAAPVSDFDTDIRAAFGLQGTLKRISAPNVVDRIIKSLGTAPPPIHLIVKWSATHGPDTVDRHIAVANEHGSVWWGLRGSESEPKIGAKTLERIRAQLAANEPTRVFLSGPTCWRTSLLDIAVQRDEIDEALIPSTYPQGQQYGLWVKITDFEKIDRPWLTAHLELAKAPGVPLSEQSLSQTTNPLIVIEPSDPHKPTSPRVWWVCQGATYRDAKEAGVLWAPKAAKDGGDRPYWRALVDARIGDRILHYANSHVRAVGTITAEAVDGPRPFGSDDKWQNDGRLVQAQYDELSPSINLSEIPNDWRIQEGGPFTKDGSVQQGYFFPLSERFVARMAERFPQLGLGATHGAAPSAFASFDLTALRAQAKDAGLELPDELLAQVLATLESGKHIILTGPPGTAKTTLAQLVAETAHLAGRSKGWVPTTATADWTTYDTIGGLRPKNDQTLEFQPGHFLSALESDQWLVIDELNRSNFDRAFGQFFTVLSGQTVVLPHERAPGDGPITLVPIGATRPAERADVVDVPAAWRIIATMNVFDKTLLFEMSYALMRRFAFIEVPSPPNATFVALIERWADGDELAAAVATALLDVRKIDAKDIGPASYRDIVRYAHARSAIDEPAKERLVFDAFYSFLLPQFEGIDDRQGRELREALKSVIRVSDRPRLTSTLNTVLGLELTEGSTIVGDTGGEADDADAALDEDDDALDETTLE